MKAKCIKYYAIGHHADRIEFLPPNFYDYRIEIHKETQISIYYVNEHPMLEEVFKNYFDDIQQQREEKINKILNG